MTADNSAVPDFSTGTPNLQTIWLERTLREAREDDGVDMIVVFMHQCAMSTSVPGNGSDLGIRRTWLPLFDRYEVDLVLSGHEHDYERTLPGPRLRRRRARHGRVPEPGPDRRREGRHAPPARRDDRDGRRRRAAGLGHRAGHGVPGPRRRRHQRPVQRLRHATPRTACRRPRSSPSATPSPDRRQLGFHRNAADSIEDAPWSAAINAGDAYGYAIFDVDPGRRPGDTTITMQYFAIPAVSNEAGSAHDGTTTLPTTPFETFVFGRGLSGKHGDNKHGHDKKPLATTTA